MAGSVWKFSRQCFRAFQRPMLQFVRHHDSDSLEYDYVKTNIQMLSQEDDDHLYIESYSQIGFKLSTGIRVVGPCAVFPRSILHWSVRGSEDINEDALTLFTLLEPKIDILVIGKGDRFSKINPAIIRYLRSKRISVEILPTDQALATFNFLNAEKRYVAGAFIPPSYIHSTDEEMGMDGKLEQANIFETPRDYDERHEAEPHELEGFEMHLESAKDHLRDRLGRVKPSDFENKTADDEKDQKEKPPS